MIPRRFHMLVWLLVIASVVAGLTVLVFRTREPEYGGKKLSEWMKPFRVFYMPAHGPPPERVKAENAIRHMGTNVIPYLLAWIRYEPMAWELKRDQLLKKWHQQERWYVPPSEKRQIRAYTAAEALQALGPEAKSAIPELVRLVNNPKRTFSAYHAAQALGAMGEEAIPALLSGWSNPDFYVHSTLETQLRKIEAQTHDVIPVLQKLIDAGDPQVSSNATAALRVLIPLAASR